MNRTQLEKKYGITIVSEDYWNPLSGRYQKSYKYYSADGCPFSNGLGNLHYVEDDCKRWEDALLHIKETKRREEIFKNIRAQNIFEK